MVALSFQEAVSLCLRMLNERPTDGEYTKPSSSSTKLSKLSYFQIPGSHLLEQVLVKVRDIYRPGILQVVFSKKYSFPNKTLIIAGVKLEETVGNSDGYFEGMRYFKCDCNHAIFVSLEEVLINVS